MSSRLARTAALAALALALTAAIGTGRDAVRVRVRHELGQTVRQYAADDAGTGAARPAATATRAARRRGRWPAPTGATSTSSNEASDDISQYDDRRRRRARRRKTRPRAHRHSPFGLAVSPDGEHVYVANQGARHVGVYDVGADGALTLRVERRARSRVRCRSR